MSPAFKVISNSWGGEKVIKDDGEKSFSNLHTTFDV